MTEGARGGDEKPSVKWLTAAEVDSWLSVVRLMTWLPWSIDQHLQRDSNLGMVEYQVLAMLSNRPEWTMRMSALAEVTNASLSRLSHLVKRLEARGLMRREPDPSDGRFTNAILTDEGFRTLADAAPGHVAHVRSLVTTSCHQSNCDASAWPPTASCRASTPLASTSPLRPPPL
jgi:DNA-binding MarR family transcriptional regulator